MSIKPQLACDFDETKLVFPLMAFPKIDGVRGINLTGTLTGRSLKKHKNKHVTALYSKPEFMGMDGELAADVWDSPSLCRDTTSAVNRIEGQPEITWWVFDCVTAETCDIDYFERYGLLLAKVKEINLPHLKIVPYEMVYSLEGLLAAEQRWLEQGFEGVIIRSLYGKHKSGRCTVKEGAYLRIKRFSDSEAVVLEIQEAMQNNNEAKTNELGRTERSSHKENKTAKGMVGSLLCKCCDTGEIITVGAGDMDHGERKFFFENPSNIVGKIIKYKSFKHGVKDKPRFPTFLSIRAESDISQ